ncbi:MAG: hypothetical protein A2096_04645 [Spirochaetes bacterium GWF1_41_5]|nr:MAG: hypothetical protein A2096_04645 [Spirochaetes bacterium GWF1_41_5]
MNVIQIAELQPEHSYEKALILDIDLLYLDKNINLAGEEIKLLKKWKIKKLSLFDEASDFSSDHVAKQIERFSADIELCNKVYSHAVKTLEETCVSLINRGLCSSKELITALREIIDLIKRNKNTLMISINRSREREFSFMEQQINTGIFSGIIGQARGYDDNKLTNLILSAALANIGMLKIPEVIRKKKDKLTPDELKLIRGHTIFGYKLIMEKMKLPDYIAFPALEHHENIDGSGYPRKLVEAQINEFSKIVAVAQEYVALTVQTAYREKLNLYKAMRTLISDGKMKFSQENLSLFLSCLSLYPVGSVVRLNSGEIGMVISANPKIPLRPVIKLLLNEEAGVLDEKKIVNLENETAVFIKDFIEDISIVDKCLEII